jgi:predicted flap endonuclease-1-like 5' DNA nuclease
MKKAYLFLALFGIWCLASAIWFMSSFNDFTTAPQTVTVGVLIAQVIIMILVSVLLGFAVAWYIREEAIVQRRRDVEELLHERNMLLGDLTEARAQVKNASRALAQARATFREDYVQISRERDRMKEYLLEEMKEKELLRTELKALQNRLKEEEQREQALLSKIEEQNAEANKKENAGVRYFINPFQIAATLESNDIDDLKKIKGIGPLIERKLNMLGIVSFKQISELSKEAIEQIAHTLKFFPDRIQRDQWVQQARECMKNSVRK